MCNSRSAIWVEFRENQDRLMKLWRKHYDLEKSRYGICYLYLYCLIEHNAQDAMKEVW
jgi:hypothetical protein